MHTSSLLVFSLTFTILQILLRPTLAQASSQSTQIEGRTKFDDDLREFVEFVKLQMKCGHPKAGIPPLAPYHSDYKEFEFNTKTSNLRGNLSDLTVNGLDDFDVVTLHWNNVLHKITFNFLFSELLASGTYKMDGNRELFGSAFKFFGDGKLHLEFTNLRAHGSFILRPILPVGGVRMQSFKIQLDLGEVTSDSTGFMNSKVHTKIFNEWIEDFTRILFEDSPEQISSALEQIIVPAVNKALVNVSWIKMVAVIVGLANDVVPNEAWC